MVGRDHPEWRSRCGGRAARAREGDRKAGPRGPRRRAPVRVPGHGTLTGCRDPPGPREGRENSCSQESHTLAVCAEKPYSLLSKASPRAVPPFTSGRDDRARRTRASGSGLTARHWLRAFPDLTGSGGLSRSDEAPCLASARTFPPGEDLFSSSPTGEEVSINVEFRGHAFALVRGAV